MALYLLLERSKALLQGDISGAKLSDLRAKFFDFCRILLQFGGPLVQGFDGGQTYIQKTYEMRENYGKMMLRADIGYLLRKCGGSERKPMKSWQS